MLDRGDLFRRLENAFFSDVKSENLRCKFERTAVELCDACFNGLSPPFWFTVHDPKHSDAVLNHALALAGRVQFADKPLEPLEALALASACYLHDLGMTAMPPHLHELPDGYTREWVDDVRKYHVSAVEECIRQHADELKLLYEYERRLADWLPLICMGHGTHYHQQCCDELDKICPKGFRGSLLSKILMVADELDLDYRRSLVGEHEHFAGFPVESQAHHYKHHYVSNVELGMARVSIDFRFPESMLREHRSRFVSLTCGKLREQLDLVGQDPRPEYREVFDFQVNPTVKEGDPLRKPCPENVARVVSEMASRYSASTAPEEPQLARPSSYYGRSHETTGPLHPILDELLDGFFEELTTPSTQKLARELYVVLDRNRAVMRSKLEAVKEFCLRCSSAADREMPRILPFLITGGTGVGKSAILQYLKDTGKLLSKNGRNKLLVVFADCLNSRSENEVLMQVLRMLVDEIKLNTKLMEHLRKAGWNLSEFDISLLTGDQLRSTIEGLTRSLHDPTQPAGLRYPVCIVLDNLDRASGDTTKSDILSMAVGHMKTQGFPFYVIPVRRTTKKAFDTQRSDIRDLPDMPVSAPNPREVIKRRLGVLFSDAFVETAPIWKKKQTMVKALGRIKLRFEDLRKVLQRGMQTLCEVSSGHTPLITGLGDTNIRNALTVYRIVMKSLDAVELLNLGVGNMVREHRLIRYLMMERCDRYIAQTSVIHNLFDPFLSNNHLAKVYALHTLRSTQPSTSGDNYVPLQNVIGEAKRNGIPESTLRRELWDLMQKEIPLVELEGREFAIEHLPDGELRYSDQLNPDDRVRLTAAGEYYLDWLMYDFAYLQCVLDDTLVDRDLAQELSANRYGPLTVQIERVEAFVRYLDQKEDEYRASRAVALEAVIPQVKKRLAVQTQRLAALAADTYDS